MEGPNPSKPPVAPASAATATSWHGPPALPGSGERPRLAKARRLGSVARGMGQPSALPWVLLRDQGPVDKVGGHPDGPGVLHQLSPLRTTGGAWRGRHHSGFVCSTH